MAACPVPEGSVVASKYRVERVLGEGGMGVVVAAWHTELEQRVAIKFLWADIAQNAGASERFRREARAAAKIRSEHVGRVLDVGTLDDGVPYMVMEYLEGRDLADEVRARHRLPVPEAVTYVLQACEALAEAHVNNIVHRDLKPENLYLTVRADGTRFVKVLDFGVSKSLVDSGEQMKLTKTSMLVGSPLYMSPEQLDAVKDIDARVDVWALGVILYELISGTTPFAGTTIPQLCNALMNNAPRPLTELGLDVPEGLWLVIRRALEKDRALRWSSVAELARALSPYAPAGSAMSIARIERVIGGPKGTVSSASEASVTALSSGVVEPLTIREGGATGDTETASGREGDGVTTQPDGTLASWGHTQGPPQKSSSRFRPILWIGAAAAVPLLAVGVYWWIQPPASAEPTAATSTAEPAHAAVEPPAPAQDEPAVEPEIPARVAAEPTVAVAEEKEDVQAEETRAAKAAKPVRPHGTVSKAAVTRVVPRPTPPPAQARPPRYSPRPAASAPEKPTATPSAPAITDFGGRR